MAVSRKYSLQWIAIRCGFYANMLNGCMFNDKQYIVAVIEIVVGAEL